MLKCQKAMIQKPAISQTLIAGITHASPASRASDCYPSHCAGGLGVTLIIRWRFTAKVYRASGASVVTFRMAIWLETPDTGDSSKV